MPDPITEEIEHGRKLLNEGKIEEALSLIEELEKKRELTGEEKLRSQIIKGNCLNSLGKSNEALRIGELAYQEGIRLKKPLLSIDAIFPIKWGALFSLGRRFEIPEEIRKCEIILKSTIKEPKSEIEQREASVDFMKGYFLYWKDEYDDALNYFEKVLPIFKQSADLFRVYCYLLNAIAATYGGKGELEKSVKFHKESIEFTKENSPSISIITGTNFQGIAGYYWSSQGDLDLAGKYMQKGLEAYKIAAASGSELAKMFIVITYYYLVLLYWSKKSPERAQEYLNKLQHYIENNNVTDAYYKLAKAQILISSNRARDWAQAERILKKLIEQPKISELTLTQLSLGEEFIPGITSLCELYLKELEITKNLDILDDIQPLIAKLFKESEHRNSYQLQASTNLLQGKISLLQMNIGDARRYLTKAQRIAEDHSLQLLAHSVSREHDKLLEYLAKLESTGESDIPISERIELASLSKLIDRMQGRRALDTPEIIEEEPILLLIIGQDGVSYFNHSFVKNWDFDDLFSSFLSAFNTFSSEIFDKSIDRIKIDENVILINPVEQFLVCYVIKGQSYPALQKLNRFSDAIKWKQDIWDALNRVIQTSEMLGLNNPESLGEVVKEIFNS